MEEFLQIIRQSVLFHGTNESEIKKILHCLSANVKNYNKNTTIFRIGDTTYAIGLVLSGFVHIIKEDFWGNRNIIATQKPSDIIGESYAASIAQPLTISAVAAEPANILLLDVRLILTNCAQGCEFHTRLVRNMVSVLAEKNLRLTEKISHITQRSTRTKLLSYLSAEALRQKNASFTIPFDRQQLADYLSVDRSALSKELGRLQDEGVLSFNKNSFMLKRSKS